MRVLLARLYSGRGGVLTHPLFHIGLVIKIIAAFWFSGLYFGDTFIPFIKHLLITHSNPYDAFFAAGATGAFPYPAAMLAIMALPGVLFFPVLNPSLLTTTPLEQFIFRIPLLLSDITILLLLSSWLAGRARAILAFYWLSPILFYISYVHGQLDVIPIALLFAALHFLFRDRIFIALTLLGVAIAAKLHIIIALPFIVIYLYRRYRELLIPVAFAILTFAVFLAINIPFLSSSAFRSMVFMNAEQGKTLDLALTLGAHTIYIVPLAVFLLILHSLSFRFMNREVFIMLIGFALSVFVLLIAPEPGRYFWIIPFLAYFFTQNENKKYALLNFALLNVLYFGYFFTKSDTEIFDSLNALEIPALLINNLMLTALQATLILNIIWIYRRGVMTSSTRPLFNMPYLIGIAGDSGSGKTTLTALLRNIIGKDNVTVVEGDAAHKWERGAVEWSAFTHLDPRANALHEDIGHIHALKKGYDIKRRTYDHDTGKFTSPSHLPARRLTIVEGLHTFFLPHIRNSLDLKIFIQPEESLRVDWKLARDTTKRSANKEKVLAQIEHRAKDAAAFVNPQAVHADIIITLRGEGALAITTRYDVSYDELLKHLASQVAITHTHNAEEQCFVFTGSPSTESIKSISDSLLSDLASVTTRAPQWTSGYNGIMQLFVFFHIIRSIKQERHD